MKSSCKTQNDTVRQQEQQIQNKTKKKLIYLNAFCRDIV